MKPSAAIFAVALAIGHLAGCSQPVERRSAADILGPDGPVSDADMRAARLLSLSNNGLTQAITDPNQLSISCIVSLEWLGERLREGGMATAEQLNALDQATKLYRSRALDGGQTSADLTRALASRRDEDIDEGQQARLSMSCLRQLAQPSKPNATKAPSTAEGDPDASPSTIGAN